MVPVAYLTPPSYQALAGLVRSGIPIDNSLGWLRPDRAFLYEPTCIAIEAACEPLDRTKAAHMFRDTCRRSTPFLFGTYIASPRNNAAGVRLDLCNQGYHLDWQPQF